MIYELEGKKIRIPDDALETAMSVLKLSQEEAVQMWLEDEGYLQNDEQVALTEKAKKNRITAVIHQARAENKKTQSERVRKADPTKEGMVAAMADFLRSQGAQDVVIVNAGKIITFKLGEDTFKVDLIRQRPKKE